MCQKKILLIKLLMKKIVTPPDNSRSQKFFRSERLKRSYFTNNLIEKTESIFIGYRKPAAYGLAPKLRIVETITTF